MKNIKKLLSLMLVLSFIPAILAGCTSENTDTTPETSDITTNTPEITTETTEETTYPELIIEITSDENRIYEYMTNYGFIPDDEVLGEWFYVDFVQEIEHFEPGNIQSSWLDFWQSVEFLESGTVKEKYSNNFNTTQKWTKGYIIENIDKVVPSYAIKQIAETHYLFVEWKSGDYYVRGDKPWYYVFKKAFDPEPPKDFRYNIYPFADVRGTFYKNDLSRLDLKDFGENILTLHFDEKTVFPSRDKMPDDDKLQPGYMWEAGKNPGFGVRALHERGITGKGVNVAIIDQPLYIDSHPEYAGKITEYKDFDCQSETSMHGPSVTSILAGETIGTAPGAKVYYAAAPSWLGDAAYYADALDWITETNKNLPDGEKIRVVSISASTTPSDPRFINGEKYLESVKRATEAGILVLDCSPENGIVGSCEYNFYNPEDITSCQFVDLSGNYPFNINSTVKILAPVNYRTLAQEWKKGDFSYHYEGQGGWSWAVPYAAGVLAMGWQVKPELTPDEIVQILLDTAYVGSDGNKYIYPTAFIKYLQNN